MPRLKKYACICSICHKTTRAPMLCEGCETVDSTFGACDFCQRFGSCECGGTLLPNTVIRLYCKPENFVELMNDIIGQCRDYGVEAEFVAAAIWNALMEGDYGK